MAHCSHAQLCLFRIGLRLILGQRISTVGDASMSEYSVTFAV